MCISTTCDIWQREEGDQLCGLNTGERGEEDKKSFDLQDIEKSKKLDEYLISQGAEHLERVFIYHGTYVQFMD